MLRYDGRQKSREKEGGRGREGERDECLLGN